jgi:hypothetical protein
MMRKQVEILVLNLETRRLGVQNHLYDMKHGVFDDTKIRNNK